MSLFVSSLASGSNGNCYYIGNEQEAVLVDVGISCRELEKRMMRQGLNIQKLKAIFISHEHTDHIAGLRSVVKKYKLPVYISTSTLVHSGMPVERDRYFNLGIDPVRVGSLTVIPFSKIHDAADPYSFVISCNGVNVGVFTDIGYACQRVREYFSQCHAAFLETNYDREMLMKGNYPWSLKKRISGGKGHLSNDQALELFLNYNSGHLSHLFLSHLSKNNNTPQLVEDLFRSNSRDTTVVLASREQETEVYRITGPALEAIPARPVRLQQGVLEF
jgi:phosphoribosyl 1,2-cyclic phosphodiesterase